MQRYEVSGLLLVPEAAELRGWWGEERGEVWRLGVEKRGGGEYGNVENEGSFVEMLLKNLFRAVAACGGGGVVASLMAKDGFGDSREAAIIGLFVASLHFQSM